jgi:hypothetical protein
VQHEGFQSDLAAHEAWVSEIGTLAEELNGLHYHGINAINERYAAIYSNWEYLVKLTQERQAALEEAERKQTRVDQLCVEFALQAPVSECTLVVGVFISIVICRVFVLLNHISHTMHT